MSHFDNFDHHYNTVTICEDKQGPCPNPKVYHKKPHQNSYHHHDNHTHIVSPCPMKPNPVTKPDEKLKEIDYYCFFMPNDALNSIDFHKNPDKFLDFIPKDIKTHSVKLSLTKRDNVTYFSYSGNIYNYHTNVVNYADPLNLNTIDSKTTVTDVCTTSDTDNSDVYTFSNPLWSKFAEISTSKIYPIYSSDIFPSSTSANSSIPKEMIPFNKRYSATFIHHIHGEFPGFDDIFNEHQGPHRNFDVCCKHLSDNIFDKLPLTFCPSSPVVFNIYVDIFISNTQFAAYVRPSNLQPVKTEDNVKTYVYPVSQIIDSELQKISILVPLTILPSGEIFIDFTSIDIHNIIKRILDYDGCSPDSSKDLYIIRKVLIPAFNGSFINNTDHAGKDDFIYYTNSMPIDYTTNII